MKLPSKKKKFMSICTGNSTIMKRDWNNMAVWKRPQMWVLYPGASILVGLIEHCFLFPLFLAAFHWTSVNVWLPDRPMRPTKTFFNRKTERSKGSSPILHFSWVGLGTDSRYFFLRLLDLHFEIDTRALHYKIVLSTTLKMSSGKDCKCWWLLVAFAIAVPFFAVTVGKCAHK